MLGDGGETASERPASKRVLVVDRQPLFRLGVAALLDRHADIRDVAEADESAEALALDLTLMPDLVIVDLALAPADGIALVRALHARRAARMLGLSIACEQSFVAHVMRAGALGFASKTRCTSELLDAVRATLAGKHYLPPGVQHAPQDAHDDQRLPLERLSAREREIFELLVRGHNNEEIGKRLFIAPKTVDTHRHNVMRKLDAHSVAELVRVAARWGALP